MVNEFQHREYKCAERAGSFQCSYPSDLNSEGRFRGKDVLEQFSISTGLEGNRIGIMVGIIARYLILLYIVLFSRK
jgi:hypothetical protein